MKKTNGNFHDGTIIISNGTQHTSSPSEYAPVSTVQRYHVEFEPHPPPPPPDQEICV